MKFTFKFIILFVAIVFCENVFSQNATFITLNSGGSFTRVTVGSSGCTSTPLNLCNNFGSNRPLSIGLDSNILYIVDNAGNLYSNILTNSGTIGNCTKLGRFANASQGYFGLTVGPNGIVYTACGSDIEAYNPATNSFSVLGTLPNGWSIGGDLLFYQGKLYEAVTGGSLIEVDLNNIANSKLYMNFNSGTNVFGFASVTVPCAANQAYAISNNGTSTDIYAVDMINKTQTTTLTCNLPFRVNDAASLAETKSNLDIRKDSLNLIGCDSILYKSIWYKNLLIFYDTVKASGGCDSVYTLVNITISKVKDTTINLSNCLSVLFNGITYASNITLKDTIKNSLGCDSLRRTINIIINKNPKNDTLNLFDCDSVYYNGTWYNSSTTLFETLKAFGGCDSVYRLIKIKLYKIPITNDILNLISCTSITYKSKTYTSIATFTDTTKSYRGCDSIYTLVNIEIKNRVLRDTIPIIFGCNSIVYKNIVYTRTTIIKDTTIKSNIGNCDSVEHYIKIEVDNVIAKKDTIFLSSCDKVIYKNIPYTTSTFLIEDTLRSINNCDSIYKFVKINITPLATAQDTIYSTHCKQVVYNNIIYNYSTIILGSIIKSLSGCDSLYRYVSITITPINPKTNTIKIESCKAIIYQNKTYNQSTILKDTIKSFQGCDSIYNIVFISIVAKNPSITSTYFTHCSSVTFNNKTYTQSINLKDTLRTIDGCDSIYNLVFIVIKKINPTKVTAKTITDCKPVNYKNKTYYITQSIFDSTIKSYQGCDSVYLYTDIVINRILLQRVEKTIGSCDSVVFRGTNYKFGNLIIDSFKNKAGCDSAVQLNWITIYPKPYVSKNNNYFALPNQSITLMPSYSNVESYSWSPKTFLDDSTKKFPVSSPKNTITYALKVATNKGCIDTASVKVIYGLDVYIPKTFSPNGDKINDTWVIEGIENYRKHSVKLFDRFGQIILNTNNYQAWDGRKNGENVPTGTYYYVVQLDATMQAITGFVTIFR